MIDYSKQLVSALKTILPTYHELTLTQGIKTPCISYMELSNIVEESGDTLEYSRLSFQIKVWGTDLALLNKYAGQIDKKLRSLGFNRAAGGELYDKNSSMIQKILTYEAKALEII
jgi:hypothetical protein